MLTGTPETVTLIPIARVEILNSRERNMKIFEEIVENIKSIGLKKPTLSPSGPVMMEIPSTCWSAARDGSTPSASWAKRTSRPWWSMSAMKTLLS